jgi:hypothetical protein
VAWELALLAVIIYVPFLQEPFGTFSFAWTDWALTVALACTIVPVLELVKVAGAPWISWRAELRSRWLRETVFTCS